MTDSQTMGRQHFEPKPGHGTSDSLPSKNEGAWIKAPTDGQCPVHPKTIVDVTYGTCHRYVNTGPAGLFGWKGSVNSWHVRSYRVVTEPISPLPEVKP